MRKTRNNIIKHKPVEIIALNSLNFHELVLKNRKPVLVEFTADWCGSCHIAAPMIEKVMRQFAPKVRFGRINYDRNWDLAHQYGVIKLPGLILFRDGKAVDYILDTPTQGDLTARLRSVSDFRTDTKQVTNK